jgi:transcriptional regulator with XRE-family HTH domain
VRAVIDTSGPRRELARRGMTQAELASIAGVSEPTVCHAMAGRMVSYLTIRKFARALTVTPARRVPRESSARKQESASDSPIQPTPTEASCDSPAVP